MLLILPILHCFFLLDIMFLQASGDVFFFNNFLDTSIRRSGIVLYFFHYFDSHSEVLEGRLRWSVGWRSKLVVRESDFVFLWHSLKVLESDMKKYWQDGHFFFKVDLRILLKRRGARARCSSSLSKKENV